MLASRSYMSTSVEMGLATPETLPSPPAPAPTLTSSEARRQSEKELLLATKPFTVESTTKGWAYTLSTFAILAALTAGTVLAPWWWLKLAFAVLEGLTIVRTFCLFHDFYHGAILRKSKLADALYSMFGLTILVPASVWTETHDYHHAHTAKMVGSHIGSYPVVTTSMWKEMKPAQRLLYRAARHPLNILFSIVTIFAVGMCLHPFLRAPKKHWGGPVSLAVVSALAYGLISTGHLTEWVYGWLLPLWVATTAGAYLFYAQHSFPDAYIADRQSWSFTGAATRSSSYFMMPAFMHWFTANIGYHHVHHLNAAIPFYRLPEAMAAVPALQTPGVVTWSPKSIVANFRLAVWDPQKEKFVEEFPA